MNDIYELDQWITADEVQRLLAITSDWQKIEYVAKEGKFADQLVATQSFHQWNSTDELAQLLGKKITDVVGQHQVIEVDYVELSLPWDIHCDYVRENKGRVPYYSLLLPLESCTSRTVFFDQTADYNDFWKYKKLNQPIEHPVDLDFWNKNLSHCWDDDRLYLSLKYVSHDWQAGNAIFFKRDLFHSSDNYHTRNNRPKKFLQILTDLE
jgi:hypothetical protein